MTVQRATLGAIQEHGEQYSPATSIELTEEQAQFLGRYVQQVRKVRNDSSRSFFAQDSNMVEMFNAILEAEELEFNYVCNSLQNRLKRQISATPNASDCVFAVVVDLNSNDSPHKSVTLLTLESAEGARLARSNGRLTFELLKDLLPEAGNLKKAISWPDPRETSEVIAVDKNQHRAAYFQNAFDITTSPTPNATAKELFKTILDTVPVENRAAVLDAVMPMTGPLEEIYEQIAPLGNTELSARASEIRSGNVTSGIIHPQTLAGKYIVWRADRIEIRVPPDQYQRVTVDRTDDGWTTTIQTDTQPEWGV